MTSLLFTLVVKKIDSRPTLVSIFHTKMQVRKWISTWINKFVPAGYTSGATFLGLLASATRR
jgi:hypothetical protein